ERAQVKHTHDVVVDRVSIAERIQELALRLEREPSFTFESCFDGSAGGAALRHHLVVTFLALLEMTRLKMGRIHQPGERGSIYISGAADGAAAPLAVEGADREYK